MREESGFTVFDNRLLMRVMDLQEKEATGGWQKLHQEVLMDFNVHHKFENKYTAPTREMGRTENILVEELN